MDHQTGFSRTLPKSFTFSAWNAGEPKTPEHASTQPDGPPPPPRHSSCRLPRFRIRSGTDVFAQVERDRAVQNMFSSKLFDIPLPSVEFPPEQDDATPEPSSPMQADNDSLLAPPRDHPDMKTPPAQTSANPTESKPTEQWSPWEHQRLGNIIERPSSVCSNVSDSSASSFETITSRPSVGGSCTSMESDSFDSMLFESRKKQMVEFPASDHPVNKAHRRSQKVHWTSEMDNHLWNTYQLYLQDPTITPFKMTPGSIPPLGVTHRVAREAKRTWGMRRLPMTLSDYKRVDRQATPTAQGHPSNSHAWPRSETSTRKRLKMLCKRKFSIAPHYQRMMQSRSPTPFDPFTRSSRESSVVTSGASGAYNTRGLGVSLASTSAPGPLSQLATEDSNYDTDWFNKPVPEVIPYGTGSATKRSFSVSENGMAPRLGSPFVSQSWGPSRSARRSQANRDAIERPETFHATGSRMRAPVPFESIGGMQSASGPSQTDMEDSPTQEDTERRLEDLFNQGKLTGDGTRRVRIRNRGATTGAMSSRGLNQLFSPPSSMASTGFEDTTPSEKPANPLSEMRGERSKRLGSPFDIGSLPRPGSSGRYVKHAASLSDPFVSGASQPEDQEMKSPLPFGLTEERHI